MNVVYYWTEDGAGERCECETLAAPADVLCYHCDGLIEQGATCARLQPATGEFYWLHPSCAQKGAALEEGK